MYKQSNRNRMISNPQSERVSVSGPKANVTIEAAFAIPFFLFAFLCLVYLMEIQAIKASIHFAALNAGKSAAEEAAVYNNFHPASFQADLINLIGAERIDRSLIEGGSSGISCAGSYISSHNEEIYIQLKYKVRLPFPSFGNPSGKFTEKLRVKGWTGYEKGQFDQEDDTIVYITDTGSVYHEDYQCSYLQLSIKFVPYTGVSELRNKDGGKYYKCEKCVHGDTYTGVYITESGNKYHNSIQCSGLKRSIRAIKKSEAGGKGGCSRCTK
ncbi:pilus assembly protein [Faecalicatena acetigenes]|uniref:Pilus assembly protein n=1 Tax=Faecalicatena acetigenes TaxID=2981790 RepID=A0ABT2TDM7_9FIRM|nr:MULTISPECIES: hypothetical protein [Lachnospiraceae]MCU6748388.1 pilus assembly protein [Faecalicatena acetigenes]SCI41152.1 Uncharacterised protein [uncultured Clostridium sp.]